MSAYDKPVSKLAESPELCTDLETLKGSEQQQAQSVILGLKIVSCANWDQKNQKKCPGMGWEGRKEGGELCIVSSIAKGKCQVLKAGQ